MKGIERIAAERKRQIEDEGFDEEHDSQHEYSELAWAAACYAAPEPIFCLGSDPGPTYIFEDAWPPEWENKWDKRDKHDRIRQLEIAGALIAAEIDRLLLINKPSTRLLKAPGGSA